MQISKPIPKELFGWLFGWFAIKKHSTYSGRIIQKDQVAPCEQQEGRMDFNGGICEILQSSAKGDADKRLKFMTKIIYTIASERFGCVEPRQPMKNYSANRRVIRIKELMKELRYKAYSSLLYCTLCRY